MYRDGFDHSNEPDGMNGRCGKLSARGGRTHTAPPTARSLAGRSAALNALRGLLKNT